MLSRKRRASSISSKNDEEPLQMDDSTPEKSPVLATASNSIISSLTAVRKKRKLDPSEMCQSLYDSIRNLKKEDGSMLCDTFIRAPKRRQEPSYYDVVNNPIDLLKIQQKLKTDVYEDLDELVQDFELLVNNAKAFYKPDTMEHQDAVALWQYVTANKQKLLESLGMAEDEPKNKRGRRRLTCTADEDGGSKDDDMNLYEELFASVMTSVDSTMNDRPLHRMFLLLPSKKMYPDYYDVIEHPIDLRLIATKIQTNAYSNLQEMEKDLLQMTKNACQFNEPGSQIYKDAKTLKKIFTQRRVELETAKVKLVKRPKSLMSAAIAALKEEVDSSDDEETSKKGEGPMWALFDHLYNAPGFSEHPGATGPPLGTSLWKLPIRRFHPEYFELIKRPISMCQIHTKLNKGEYANISDLTADLYLMLDNAKKAYPPTHRTHKDAVKMLKLMNAKLVEDTPDQDTSEMEEEEEDEDADDDDESEQNTLVASAGPTPEKRKKGRPRLNQSANSSTLNASVVATPKPQRMTITPQLKKKILALHKYLLDFSLGTRKPIDLFMEKPPRKIYPDYYDVIQNPIDMNTIEHNIRADKYRDVEDVVADYRLMFANCRQYNEEGSNIYEDANVLEKALNEKLLKDFPGLNEIKKPLQKLKCGRRRANIPMGEKLWQFYESIRDYQEPKGKRQLSLIFTKLPSKTDYPDYYDIIKEPIDMEKIANKLKQGSYETIDELAADFLLMLENSCKYNEPDSQIYKDALVLQQLTLQLKQSLRSAGDTVPDVGLAVQELLMSLFSSLYNHQDEAGRCYSDSLLELPEYDELPGDQKVRGISLDVVKRRLYKGVYKRLDIFQEDVFACLERARKLSRTDSDIFQDSIELQTFFIKKRDEVCRDTLSSPALSYTLDKMMAEVELLKQQKSSQEEQDQDDKEDVDRAAMQGESMTFNQKVFSPGDFVYFTHNEHKSLSIAYIERLWTTEDDKKMMYGSVFLSPHETYHVQTRKFFEKEVFKSSVSQNIPMERVQGKCYVMHIKDYIKAKPENFDDKDVFVCESRYHVRSRSFKKFKNWPFVRENDPVKLTPRDKPIEIKRVMSVFKERVEKHKGELEELKMQESLVEKEKPNVACDPPPNAEPNAVYYQQFNTICSGVVKTGDFVYVATQGGKQSIAQIHQIWEQNNKSYFKGPWLLTPSEIQPPLPTQPPFGKQFYRQELLLSTVEEASPIISIVGRCAVLEYQEYITCRPTEFVESDVYICEAAYDELRKSLRKFNLPNSLRKFIHSAEVTQDEILYFKVPIKPSKDVKNGDLNESLGIMEDSMDGNPPSVSSDIVTTSSPAPSVSSTPLSSKKTKTTKKSLTGYILYSSEHRKGICTANPDASFGDISRMVGNEWKNLPASVKQAWEDRAQRINEETKARFELMEETLSMNNCASPGPNQGGDNQQVGLTFECHWDKCDYQFEDSVDCMEHCIADNTGHVQRTASQQTESEYYCQWRNCIRMKKNLQAFPSLVRLIKHVREVHLTKCSKLVMPNERSKNFVPRKSKTVQFAPQQQQQQMTTNVNPMVVNASHSPRGVEQHHYTYQPQIFAPPPEPLFVTVPPRPQRVLHSEAYIKYIASLQGTTHQQNAQNSANWKRALTPVTPADITKPKNLLPSQWLGRFASSNADDVVRALCHMRNYMMNDVLQIERTLDSF
ncbi:protein polybromo-1 [Musca domestica]|uniref:Protein polybromo-1 n=1 Tax=Musca domestica TaxID=7370 RepID=A0A9J7CLD5_MUSDO|nr:protein polybromo-1 [Musca domestica]